MASVGEVALENIDKTISVLVENNASDEVIAKFRELRKEARWQPSRSFNYEAVMILNVYTDQGIAWADKAIEVWVGPSDPYDPSRE